MVEVADTLLKDRICNATDRIPTSRWPFFSQSLQCHLDAGQQDCNLTFEAERDTLLTDLSIAVTATTGGAPLGSNVSIEYCNVTYADHTDSEEFAYCCSRKPIFLVGVRENKKLRFAIHLGAVAPTGGADIVLTVSGFQGDGCCS